MASQTNGTATRFNDTPLSFGIERFASTDRALWRFRVMRYINNNPLIEIDADLATLREMQRFIEKAIETVTSDGGRKDQST